MTGYPILSQRSPECESLRLGYGAETVGSAGCLFTSLLMMVCRGVPFKADYYAAFMKCLNDHGNYTPASGSNLASFDISACRPAEWGACTLVHVSGLFPGPVPADDLSRLIAHVQSGQPSLMCVDSSLSLAGLQEHWVLITATDGDDCLIHDPWFGDDAALEPRFGATISQACYRYVLYDCPAVTVTPAVPSGPVTPPVPVVSPAPPVSFVTGPAARLGYNVLFNGQAGMEAYNDGCRFFLVMNDTDGANALAAKGDCTVLYRQYWDHAPSVDEAVNALSGRLHPAVIRTGINECEHINGSDISWHAQFDIAVATRLQSMNPAYRYAAGTFSMGTPDFTNSSICDAIRQHYALAYNTGLIWWDQHLYSPTLEHIHQDDQLIWYERRWEFLFTQCGFHPDVRHIVSGECGLDVSGTGGFMASGATNDQVVAYCRRWREVQSRAVVINGQSFASPVVGGALFQLGDSGTAPGHWGGYDLQGYRAAIRSAGVY